MQCLAARTLGEMGDAGAAEVLADAIKQNGVLSNEFPEAVDVARTASTALARILAASAAASVPLEVLRRVSEMPDILDRMDAAAVQEPAVDCAPIRDLAHKELQRRGA